MIILDHLFRILQFQIFSLGLFPYIHSPKQMREPHMFLIFQFIDFYMHHISICRFVSCLAFVPAQENPHSLLLSGSGDSTVSVSLNLS